MLMLHWFISTFIGR